MNERMIKLAEQAGYNIKELDVQEQMVAEKFAELILTECIDIAEQTRFEGKVVAERIKFVFGVDQ